MHKAAQKSQYFRVFTNMYILFYLFSVKYLTRLSVDIFKTVFYFCSKFRIKIYYNGLHSRSATNVLRTEGS